MIQDIDIFRTARILIDKHGDNAPAEAQRRMEEYRAKGDNDALDIWRRIAEAVKILNVPNNATKTIQ
jgi:hypothetical protein